MQYLCGMKIQEITGDITNSTATYIAHCVNCQGKMNSGVAKAIRMKWPVVYKKYREFFDRYMHPGVSGSTIHWDTEKFLGRILQVKINNTQSVLNMFCQNFYGYDGKQYVSYDAIKDAFERLAARIKLFDESEQENVAVAIPYKFGSGLAGGDWNTVYNIIVTALQELPITLEIWKLE